MEEASTDERALWFTSRAPEQTRGAAAALARTWLDTTEGAGLTISLEGDLGVGKTVFVKGLAEGIGLDPDTVSSPTFVLANVYPASAEAALHHVDFYRLEEAAELEGMGFFDLIAPGAILAVEWGDRFPHALPTDRVDVALERVGETERRVRVLPRGAAAEALVGAWRTRMGGGS